MAGHPRLLVLAVLALWAGRASADVYDITTIYKLQRAASGATSLESGEIIARNNARGMPLRRGNTTLSVSSEERCCSEWESDGWRKLSTKEAEETVPILDPTLRESAQDRGFLRHTGQGWQGTLGAGETVRLDFTPESHGVGYLSVLLCDTPFPRSCWGLTIAGHAQGRLRYYWSQHGTEGESGPFWVPGGGQVTLKTTVDTKDESVREEWSPVRRYTLLMERTSAGQLHAHLVGGDRAQEEQRVFDVPGRRFKHLFVDRYKNDGTLAVQADPAWQGRVDAGRELPLVWTPDQGGRLGVFLCTKPRGDACYGAVVTGSDGAVLRTSWGKYATTGEKAAWMPGRGDRGTRVTVINSTEDTVAEGWTGPEQYNLTLKLEGWRASLILAGAGGRPDVWEVPVGHNYIVIGSFKGKGTVQVLGDTSTLSTPSIVWPVWGLDFGRTEGSLTSPPIRAPRQHQLCVVLGAKVPADGRLQLGFKGVGPGYRQITPIISLAPGETPVGWVQIRKVVDLPLELVRRTDKIQLVLNATTSSDENVYVQIADTCNALAERDITTFVTSAIPVNQLFGFDIASTGAGSAFQGKPGPCKHGGLLDLAAGRCRCPPGFTGVTCELGCGNNQIGGDCNERCSDDTRDGCEGLLVCGPGLPCTCAPGFKGPSCDKLCPNTKFGPGCKFTCGKCQNGAPCDKFTGRCPNGCRSGFQPPLCTENCGTTGWERQELIQGGDAINISSFPWQAGLYHRKASAWSRGEYKFECGGSLIRENLVLTAAHCVTDQTGAMLSAADYMVALGKTHSAWNHPEDRDKEVKLKVYEIVTPPNYRGQSASYTNDIAVLVLEQRTSLSQYVTPVCINWSPENEIPLRSGVEGMVAGWGATENQQTSDSLYSAKLPVVTRDACYNNLEKALHVYITPDKLCAGFVIVPEGKVPAVAKGDSGGGLCFKDSRDTWYVRGVVSLGLAKHPMGLYTDVNYFRDFLNSVRERVLINEHFGLAFSKSG